MFLIQKIQDKLLVKAHNNHITILIREMPTEITMGIRCSTEKFCCKTRDSKENPDRYFSLNGQGSVNH